MTTSGWITNKMAAEIENIKIIMDSRGANMELPLKKEAMRQNFNSHISVEVLRGANIEGAVLIAEEILKNDRFDQVYFAIGVNGLTVKHTNDKVTGAFDDVSNLVEIMEKRLDNARCSLNKYTNKLIITAPTLTFT